MWLDLLFVGLVGGLVAADTTAAWQVMICRPIVSGPLTGLVLGDLHTGLLMGAIMELMWAGIVPAGASLFPDSNVAAVVATATTITVNSHFQPSHFIIPLSILYSIPVAYIGSKLIVFMRKRNSVLIKRALKFAEGGSGKKVALQNWMGIGNSFVRGFIFGGVAFAVGFVVLFRVVELSVSLNNHIADQSIIPLLAIGGAVALTIFGKRRFFPYIVAGLIIGFFFSFL